jgi:hypothetical protein
MHPDPLDDESLLSWLHRSAIMNGQNMSEFASITTNDVDILKRDLDVFLPEYVITQLIVRTGKTREQILETTFAPERNNLFADHDTTKQISWVMPIGIKMHGETSGFGQQYCPQCLADEPIYFRKAWRLLFVTACTNHKIYLHDHCPHCHSRVNLRKSYIKDVKNEIPSRHGLKLCSACGGDLTVAVQKPADDDAMAFQAFNIDMMNNGYGTLGSQPIGYSHLYFQGLRLLISAVLQKMGCRRLHEVACKAVHIEPFRGQLKMQRHVELATLSLETRIKAMKMVSWLKSDWPLINSPMRAVRRILRQLSCFRTWILSRFGCTLLRYRPIQKKRLNQPYSNKAI